MTNQSEQFHLFNINEENDIFNIDITIFHDYYSLGLKDRLTRMHQNIRNFNDYLAQLNRWAPPRSLMALCGRRGDRMRGKRAERLRREEIIAAWEKGIKL
ncbi:hypothetical protein V8E54_001207 [Elaphomyces granulatus]